MATSSYYERNILENELLRLELLLNSIYKSSLSLPEYAKQQAEFAF